MIYIDSERDIYRLEGNLPDMMSELAAAVKIISKETGLPVETLADTFAEGCKKAEKATQEKFGEKDRG